MSDVDRLALVRTALDALSDDLTPGAGSRFVARVAIALSDRPEQITHRRLILGQRLCDCAECKQAVASLGGDDCSFEGCDEGRIVRDDEIVDCPECWPSGGPLGD